MSECVCECAAPQLCEVAAAASPVYVPAWAEVSEEVGGPGGAGAECPFTQQPLKKSTHSIWRQTGLVFPRRDKKGTLLSLT